MVVVQIERTFEYRKKTTNRVGAGGKGGGGDGDPARGVGGDGGTFESESDARPTALAQMLLLPPPPS